MGRFRVFYNAHGYSDGSGPARLTGAMIKAESIDEAEEAMSERRERQFAYDNDPTANERPEWCDSSKRRHPYHIGMIHFGHTEELAS